jgi:hypothetical protein
MTTLNEEYKGRVTYCSPLASVVCKLLDYKFTINFMQNLTKCHYLACSQEVLFHFHCSLYLK